VSIARVLVIATLSGSATVASAQASGAASPEAVTEPAVSAAPLDSSPETPSPRFQKPKLALALVGGGTFQLLLQTPMLLGGVELRLGALTRRVEVTARLRFQAGRTLGGLLLLEPTFALGIMVPVDSRVRIGTELVVPPFIHSLSVRYVTRPEWKTAILGGASIETSVDIVKQTGDRALFWVGTVGVDITSASPGNGKTQSEGQIGPRLWTGIGYRL
jgi:hypothetical protein